MLQLAQRWRIEVDAAKSFFEIHENYAENIVVDHEPIEMVLRKPASIDGLREAIHHVTSGDWQRKKGAIFGS